MYLQRGRPNHVWRRECSYLFLARKASIGLSLRGAMNRTNGHNSMRFQTLCPPWYSWYSRWLWGLWRSQQQKALGGGGGFRCCSLILQWGSQVTLQQFWWVVYIVKEHCWSERENNVWIHFLHPHFPTIQWWSEKATSVLSQNIWPSKCQTFQEPRKPPAARCTISLNVRH